MIRCFPASMCVCLWCFTPVRLSPPLSPPGPSAFCIRPAKTQSLPLISPESQPQPSGPPENTHKKIPISSFKWQWILGTTSQAVDNITGESQHQKTLKAFCFLNNSGFIRLTKAMQEAGSATSLINFLSHLQGAQSCCHSLPLLRLVLLTTRQALQIFLDVCWDSELRTMCKESSKRKKSVCEYDRLLKQAQGTTITTRLGDK